MDLRRRFMCVFLARLRRVRGAGRFLWGGRAWRASFRVRGVVAASEAGPRPAPGRQPARPHPLALESPDLQLARRPSQTPAATSPNRIASVARDVYLAALATGAVWLAATRSDEITELLEHARLPLIAAQRRLRNPSCIGMVTL